MSLTNLKEEDFVSRRRKGMLRSNSPHSDNLTSFKTVVMRGEGYKVDDRNPQDY
jgi:hypothetical protein